MRTYTFTLWGQKASPHNVKLKKVKISFEVRFSQRAMFNIGLGLGLGYGYGYGYGYG